jgi:hypothetical protein
MSLLHPQGAEERMAIVPLGCAVLLLVAVLLVLVIGAFLIWRFV